MTKEESHDDCGSPNKRLSFNGSLQQYSHDPATPASTVSMKAKSPPKSTKRKAEEISNVVSGSSSSPMDTPRGSASLKAPRPPPRPRRTAKKKKGSSGYAPPETYAHLNLLPDTIVPNLICVFVGLNPGIKTAQMGHAYSHPSNLFWKLLHSSGLTPRRFDPTEDRTLPALCSLGNTNIVARPTRDQSELSAQEMDDSVSILVEKMRKFQPEAVCLVGKGIWESVYRARYGRPIGKGGFKYGWQDECERMGPEGEYKGARVFVATTTSGLAASLKPAEKLAIWKPLGDWVQQRRAERAQSKLSGEAEEASVAV